MESSKLSEVLRRIKRRRTVRRVVAMLSVVILLATMNTLKKEADTLERLAACGMAEHLHGEECYDAEGTLICGMAEHVHTDACFQQRPVPENVQALEAAPSEVGDQELSAVPEAEVVSQAIEAPAEEITLELGELENDPAMEVAEPSSEDSDPQAETENEEPSFSLKDREFALASEIASVNAIDIALVSDVGAVLNDDAVSCVGVEAINGDWVVYPTRDFEEAELAFFIDEGIGIVKLTDGHPIAAQNTEEDAGENTEEDAGDVEASEPAEDANTEDAQEDSEPESQEALEDADDIQSDGEDEEEAVIQVDEEAEEIDAGQETEQEIEKTEEAVTDGEETDGEIGAEDESGETDSEEAGEDAGEEADEEADATEAETDEEADEEADATDAETDGEAVEEVEAPVDDLNGSDDVSTNTAVTVDLADVETYPLSLRAVMTAFEAKTDAVEESEQAAEEGEEASEEIAEPEQTTEGASEEIVEPEQEISGQESAETPATIPTPAEAMALSVEYDDALLSIEATEDDRLITPAASFDSTDIVVGGIYVITLRNGSAEATGEVPEIPYPAQRFEDSTDYVTVTVEADEGAFPEGTTMRLADVEDEGMLSDIGDAAAQNDFIEVQRVHAVDITFLDVDGSEIEPLIPISVVMTVRELEGDEETVVVHMDDAGNAELVEDAEPGEAAEDVTFSADTFSVYAVVVTKKLETRYITVEGETYNITVSYGPEAEIPAGAALDVREIGDDEAEAYRMNAEEALDQYKIITNARFFDISIMDGENAVQPAVPVTVQVTLAEDVEADASPCAVHFADDQTEVLDAAEAGETVVFRADGFSVWGVVYTVDFHYAVNGQTYDYSIPGGGYMSFTKLMEVLHVADNDEQAEPVESVEPVEPVGSVEPAELQELEDNSAMTLDSVQVSEATKRFVANVDKVEFSASSLVWVGKVDDTITVGELKQANGLETVYNAELTEEQIAGIDAQTVEAGDWALISVQPFTSEESLTVTMKNGDQFVIWVTDAQPAATDKYEFAAGNTNHFVIWSNRANDGKNYALKTDGTTAEIDPSQIDRLGQEYQWTITPRQNGGRYDFRPVTDSSKALVLNDYHTSASKLVNSNANDGIYLYPPYTDHRISNNDTGRTSNNAGWIVEGQDWTRLNLGWTSHQFESNKNYCSDINITKQVALTDYIALSPMNENGVLLGNPDSGNVTSTHYKNMTIDGYTIDNNDDANLDKSRLYIPVQYDDSGTATITLPSNSQLGSGFSVSSADTITHSIQQDSNKYQWALHGWINIATGEYYDVTDGPVTATVSRDKLNVFYADWWPVHYDYSVPEGQLAATVDTSSFVNIKMWDYNEMYNITRSLAVKVDGDRKRYDSRDSIESEEWYILPDQGVFQFVDNTDPRNCWQYGTLGNTQGRDNDYKWSNYSNDGTLGIIGEQGKAPSTGVLESLFPDTVNSGSGVRYIGESNYLFSYDPATKQYSYDSAKNGVAYSRSEQRFYVAKEPRWHDTYVWHPNEEGGPKTEPRTGFLPYNNYNDQLDYRNGTTNYWFGMSINLDFWLPDAPGHNNANRVTNTVTGQTQNMRFEFTGDDDVWVLIDGKLALDIGGIHEAVGGYIDFTTGEIKNAKGNTYRLSDMGIGAGAHTLSFYYLEQGGNASNCKITFNLMPRWVLEPVEMKTAKVAKTWSENTPDAKKETIGFNLKAGDDIVATIGYEDGQLADGVWFYEWEYLNPDKEYTIEETENSAFIVEEEEPKTISTNRQYWAAASYDDENAFGDETILLGNGENDGGRLLKGDGTCVDAKISYDVVHDEDVNNDVKWEIVYTSEDMHFYIKNGENKYLSIKSGRLELTNSENDASWFYIGPTGDVSDAQSDYRLVIDASGEVAVGQKKPSSAAGTESEDRVHLYTYHSIVTTTVEYAYKNIFKPTIILKKVDADKVNAETLTEEDLLRGAAFTISKKTSKDAVGLDESWGEGGSMTLRDEKKPDGTYTLNGVFEFADLSAGYYTIDEVVFPDGYVRVTDKPSFEVIEDPETGALTIELTEGAGDLIRLVENEFTLIVGNTRGVSLPSTGGPGTTLIYTFGSLLTLAALALLIRRRAEQLQRD